MSEDIKQSIEIRPEDKTPELIAEITGLPMYMARFIYALEQGEIDGDTPGGV